MKQRSIGVSILLTIITCGIYGIFWFIFLTDDVNTLRGGRGVSGGTAFLYTIITCGIYSIFWAYKMGEYIDALKAERGATVQNNSALIYLLLSIFGLSIVTWALLQSELNNMIPGDEGTM